VGWSRRRERAVGEKSVAKMKRWGKDSRRGNTALPTPQPTCEEEEEEVVVVVVVVVVWWCE